MLWLLFAFASALFLGVYDASKKFSLNQNAVIPVLFLNILFCFLMTSGLWVLSRYMPDVMKPTIFYVPKLKPLGYELILIKSFIVLLSWGLTYTAMKHLPLTITAPIAATRPVLVLLGALVVFKEQLNLFQWIGVLITILSFYILSLAGKKEGIQFGKSKLIFVLILATILGAVSALYDKTLLFFFSPVTLQTYNNIFQLPIMGLVMLLIWLPRKKTDTPFRWTWGIVCISFFITLADFLYFYALSIDGAMVSVVSMVRRGSVVVSFLAGAILFKERNLKPKILDLALLLVGMIFLFLGTIK